MVVLTDGTLTVEIEMLVWDGTNYGDDLAGEFFMVGGLPLTADGKARIVKDVAYCIIQAEDWAARRGDFWEDADDDGERVVHWARY